MRSRPADMPAHAAPAAPMALVWRIALLGCAALAAAGVLVAGQHSEAAGAARAADPDLLTLLRLMAGIKGAAAIALLWLAQWRLRRPATAALAAGLVGAGVLMVAGPALIWTMAGVGLGALAFYAGVATLGGLLWSDRATLLAMVATLGRTRGR